MSKREAQKVLIQLLKAHKKITDTMEEANALNHIIIEEKSIEHH